MRSSKTRQSRRFSSTGKPAASPIYAPGSGLSTSSHLWHFCCSLSKGKIKQVINPREIEASWANCQLFNIIANDPQAEVNSMLMKWVEEAKLGKAARAGLERRWSTKVWGGQKHARDHQDRIHLGIVQGDIIVGRDYQENKTVPGIWTGVSRCQRPISRNEETALGRERSGVEVTRDKLSPACCPLSFPLWWLPINLPLAHKKKPESEQRIALL